MKKNIIADTEIISGLYNNIFRGEFWVINDVGAPLKLHLILKINNKYTCGLTDNNAVNLILPFSTKEACYKSLRGLHASVFAYLTKNKYVVCNFCVVNRTNNTVVYAKVNEV